jgi:hypothetical protein
MNARPLAALAALLALPAYAGTVGVEVSPELGNLGSAPSAAASFNAVPLQLAPSALVPSLSLGAPALAAPVLAPTIALAPLMPAALVPAPSAAAKPVLLDASRPALIKSLAAPALDVSKLGAGASAGAAEADFNARAQLDAPAALADGVLGAPAAEGAPKKSHLTLVHSAKAPAKTAAERSSVEGSPLDLVATVESLRAMAERGESRVLIQNADGRWFLAPRAGGSTAYPTPAELEAAAGHEGRFFVVSKAGLVEWNSSVPKNVGASLRTGLNALAARVPFLYPLALARLDVAVRRVPWSRVVKRGIDDGEAPVNAQVVVDKVIPPLIAAEFPVVAAKLGRSVAAAYKADVLARSNGYRMYWHSATTYKDHPDNVGIPDGHFRSDFGIRLMVKPDWGRLKDLPANYRPLFAHEYVHWLQNEGFISTKYGAEIAAVAVEVLRAIELVGLEDVRTGRAGTVHPGVLGSFDGGREWARGGFRNDNTPYSKGALAGAAYEAAQVTGRPEAAWEFLNLVIAGKGALEPADAWARAAGSK